MKKRMWSESLPILARDKGSVHPCFRFGAASVGEEKKGGKKKKKGPDLSEMKGRRSIRGAF